MKTDKTPRDILKIITANHCRELTEERALQAMEEYGRQCWEASRNIQIRNEVIFSEYTDFNHYLKTLKNGLDKC